MIKVTLSLTFAPEQLPFVDVVLVLPHGSSFPGTCDLPLGVRLAADVKAYSWQTAVLVSTLVQGRGRGGAGGGGGGGGGAG